MNNYIIPDIWHETGAIDWAELKKQTPFLIIKGTQRADFVSPTLDKYIQKCEELKIPYFVYAYYEHGNEKTQTEFLIKTCAQVVGDYFVGYALDFEGHNSPEDICKSIDIALKDTKKVLFYIPHEESATYKAVIKAGYDKKAKVWDPRYGFNNGLYVPLFPPHKEASLHQYTDKGVVDYIKGTVDLHRLTGVTELSWFITPTPPNNKPAPPKEDPNPLYGKILPLPKRGYYKLGDGYLTNKNMKDSIKLVQTLCNWVLTDDMPLVIDGKYGKKTRSSVELLQFKLGVKIDGLFGPKTFEAACMYKKGN